MNKLPATVPVVEASELVKSYRRGAEEVRALAGASFRIEPGEFVAVVGPSGAGKTTLLNLVGCMDAPSAGVLRLAGREVQEMNERERTHLRRERLGFVFQHFGLVPTLTVAENVGLPLLFARRTDSARVAKLLDQVGLAQRAHHRPHELSGGEMQRVAIARALVNEPALLLADEPTGNLDAATGASVIKLFAELHARGLTILVATHNADFAAAAQRRLSLRSGLVVES